MPVDTLKSGKGGNHEIITIDVQDAFREFYYEGDQDADQARDSSSGR